MPLDYPEESKGRLAVDEYLRPAKITLKDGELYWPKVVSWRVVKPTVDTFLEFLDLAKPDSSDGDVLRFVRRWGVLKVRSEGGNPFITKPASYRKWASVARAIQEISQQLAEGKVGEPEHWRILGSWLRVPEQHRQKWPFVFDSRRSPHASDVVRALLISYVNSWVVIGDVRPALSEDFSLTLAANGLFGALALQLLENVARYQIAACTGCRKFFDTSARGRRPKSGQGRYCPACQEAGVPVAIAKRKQLLRQKKARKR